MEPIALPSEAPRPVRPVAVTILGWFFIVFSVFTLISSAFALVSMQLMRSMSPEGEFPPKGAPFPPGFGAFSWMFDHYLALVLLQAAAAVFSLYAAVRFLKLRSWSRTYFEAVNWLGLATIVFFGVFFAAFWVAMTSTVPDAPSQGEPPPALFGVFGAVMSLFITLFNGVFPALLIWFLRSRFIRPAFSP